MSDVVDHSIDKDSDIDPLKDYKGKWVNLWFATDGKAYRGSHIYDTEALAKAGIDKAFSTKSITIGVRLNYYTPSILLAWSKIAFAQPIPLKGS